MEYYETAEVVFQHTDVCSFVKLHSPPTPFFPNFYRFIALVAVEKHQPLCVRQCTGSNDGVTRACLQRGNKAPLLTMDTAAAAAKTAQLNPSAMAEQNTTVGILTISDLSCVLQRKKQDSVFLHKGTSPI